MNFRIRPAISWSVLWIVALATATGAAEVVELRVGRHPTFTRVVFELDAPAGYRIERRTDGLGGATSILVTMEASAEARTVANQAGMIESVTVEEQLGRAVARIHLRKPNLRLKEMILSNPPRIVLDVMHDPPSTATAPLTTPSTAPTTKPRDRGEKIAKTPTPKSVEPKPAVSPPSPVAQSVKPAVSRPSPVKKPVTKPVETKTVKPVAIEVAQAPKGKPAAKAQPAVPDPRKAEKKEDIVAVVTPRTAPKPSVTPKKKPASRLKSPAPPPTTAQSLVDSTGLTPVRLAAGAVGAVLVVVGFVFFRRRGRASAEAYEGIEDVDNVFPAARGPETNAPVGGTEAEADTTAVPSFGDPGEGSLFGDLDSASDTVTQQQPTETVPVAGPGGGLFGDEEKEESTMEQMSTPMDGMDASAIPGAMPPASDIARIVNELEQRLNTVETRLDESVEACERLERQMAAQSEELRVQRAAIARTQRALRSLSRTDDEQATEPAIREPR